MLGEGVDNEAFSAFAGHIYGFCYVLRCGFSTAIFPKGKEGISLENQNIFVILVVYAYCMYFLKCEKVRVTERFGDLSLTSTITHFGWNSS